MKSLMLIFLFPLLLCAQGFEFELQPAAFPVEINSWRPYAPWAGGMDETTPELCDLDNDGDLDFFSGDYCGYVKYFINVGLATQPNFIFITDFLDSLHSAGLPDHGYSHVDFTDIDGDGDKDALVSYSRVLLFHNIGTAMQPSFSDFPDTLYDTAGDQIISMHASLVDINGDGKVDLFAGHYAGYIKYYQNVGTPTNYSFQLISSNWLNNIVSGGYADPCFADLDHDGDLDLLVGTGDGTIDYYRNDGTVTNPQMTYMGSYYFGIDVGDAASPELADIDGDGDLDLFVGRSHWADGAVSSGDVYFYQNNGTPIIPNFQLVTTSYMTWNCGGMARPRLIDIDGDGDPDIFSDRGYQIVFYRNQGSLANPCFVWETDNFANITMPGACLPWFCDLDADGDYDLLIGPGAIPGPPGLYYYRNDGTPQNPNFVYVTNDLVPGVFSQSSVVLNPCTADIDADGDLDLFVRDNIGNCYFFLNVGMPSHFQFQFITSNWQNLHDALGAQTMCFYDIDGDGDLDLFVNHETIYSQPWGKNLRFYRNIGTPQNANLQLELEDVFPELMIWNSAPYLIDMDQDGDGDLFVGDAWGGIRFFRNITDTTAVPLPGTAPAHPCKTTLSIGPNPANPITAISYKLQAASVVNLAVYDIAGRKVTTLVSGKLSAGEHTVTWDASGNASGVYLIQLLTPQETVIKKLVVVK